MSILGGLNQASRGVQVYAPNGRNPLDRPAPQQTYQRPRGGGGSYIDDLLAMSPGGQTSKEDEEDEPPIWKRGLGYAIGNPIVQTALKPLEILDYGRRAATLAAEEISEGLGGREFKAQLNEDGSLKDTRSNMDKLKDPTYGVGQLLGDTWDDSLPGGKRNVYANLAGLAGDVILDPLTWTTGIGGAVTKGGTSLNKANRAGIASKMLAEGVSEADVTRFLRKGAAAVDKEVLEKVGAQAPAFRLGTKANNVRVPGLSKGSELASRGVGEAADRFRQTKLGRLGSGWRDPEELAADYNTLFRGEGGQTVRQAATNVSQTNFERVAKERFSNLQSRQYRKVTNKIARFSDETQRLITDSLENESLVARLPQEALAARNAYKVAYEKVRQAAEAEGLSIANRANYSPHVLTKDAARWVRSGGDASAEVRKAGNLAANSSDSKVFRLNDPSGVTMARQFIPGQELEVNGTWIKFEPDVPVTISDVNSKFRAAGLDFDYFETKPQVIFSKYVDMISGDVGKAVSLRNLDEAGYGGATKINEATRGVLGLGEDGEAAKLTVREAGDMSLRKPQEGDVERLAATADGDVQNELIQAVDATREVPSLNAAGQKKLSKKGKARIAEGVAPEDLEDSDFLWNKPTSETTEFNQAERTFLSDQAKANDAARGDAARGVVAQADAAKKTMKTPVEEAFSKAKVELSEATAVARTAKNELKAASKALDEVVADEAATRSALATAAQVRDDAIRSLDMMDQYLAKRVANTQTAGIKLIRDELMAEKDALAAKMKGIIERLQPDNAQSALFQADALKKKIDAPVEAAEAALRQRTEAAAESLGLPAARENLQQLTDEFNIQNGATKRKPHQTNQKKLKTLTNKKNRAAREVKDLETRLAASPDVVLARKEYDKAVRLRSSRPAQDGIPNNLKRGGPGIKPGARIRGDQAFSDEQLSELRKFHRDRIDPGAERQVERLRAQSNINVQGAKQVRDEIAPRVREIDEELTGIINDPAVRRAATDRGSDKLVEPTVKAQAEPRSRSKEAIHSAEEASGLYIGELEEVVAEHATRLKTLNQAMQSEQAAAEVKDAAKAVVNENAAKLRAINYTEFSGKAADAPLVELARHTDNMKQLAEDLGLDPKIKAAVDANMVNADQLLGEVARRDLSAEQIAKMRENQTFGRVIKAQLDETKFMLAKNLTGDEYAVTKALMDSMTRKIVKTVDDNQFWRLIDSLTGLFKTYATLTPGFHVRNAMSAAFVNASEGVTVKTQLEGASLMRAFRRADDPIAWIAKQDEDVRKAFDAVFGSSIGGQFNERGVGTRGTAFFKFSEKAYQNKATELSRRAGEMVEGGVRLPLALDTIRNGGDTQEALMRITRAHFDYSQVSSMDRKMKRLIPFWTFMSRNLPLQLTQMYTKPRTYAKYNSLIRNFRGDEPEGTPEYFGNIGAWRFQDAEVGGDPLFLQFDFAHTRLQEDIDNLEDIASGDLGKALSNATPFLTAPIEYATKKNLYTGQEYDDNTDFRELSTLEKPIEMLAQFLGQTQTSPGGKTAVNDNFLNALRSIIPLYDRGVRLSPGENDRLAEQWARTFGLPARTLSQSQIDSTLRGQYYDDLDAQRRQQALAALDA